MWTRNLEVALGLSLRQPELYQRALTHRGTGAANYERLEFLGDALVDLFASELLFETFPDADEGDLSRVRATLVSETPLAEIAVALGLPPLIRLGRSELATGGWNRASIQADVLEALVAAVYLDHGHAVARTLVRGWLQPRLDPRMALDQLKDAKTRLQEWLQGRKLPLPGYVLVGSSGADHQKQFTVACEVPSHGVRKEAEAGSRRAAERLAAAAVLDALQGSK